jgi:DnaJ-class molecular chaperone
MLGCGISRRSTGAFSFQGFCPHRLDLAMSNAPNQKGPNTKKKQKCKNCEGKGLLKKGDKVLKCQRCHGTGLR